ncbi:MAG: hypothetical protein R8K46_01160 [Mariprofundaceae bacterium]
MKEAEAMQRLRAEIDVRLQLAIHELRRDTQVEAETIKKDAEKELQQQIRATEAAHTSRIQRARSLTLRRAREAQKARLWAFERESIDEVRQGIVEKLAGQGFEADDFHAWFEQASITLGAKEFLLEANDACLKRIRLKGVNKRGKAMLGGAQLTDMESGRQVDGSWDRRLDGLMPDIRQRWKEDVGIDH